MSHTKKIETSFTSEISKTVNALSGSRSDFSDSPFGFDSIHGQDSAVFMLKKMLLLRNIPNALLFTGNRDTGKKKAALLFAMALNCKTNDGNYQASLKEEQDSVSEFQDMDKIPPNESLYRDEPCNKCISCRKILSEMHPDIIIVSPEKDKIKISRVRKINADLTMRPNEAKMRMVLIEDAEKMNKEAGNALLKILEEPPDKTFFILLSKNPADILPTIISRCMQIKFRQISCKSIETRLINEYGIEPVTASIAAQYSNGSIRRAFMFTDINKQADTGKDKDTLKHTHNLIKRRRWLIEEISHLIMNNCKERKDTSIVLAMAEKLSNDAENIKDSILILKTWFRDLAVYMYSPDKIINCDFSSFSKDITQCVSAQRIISWFKEINAAENKIKSNTSIRLALECFFLKMLFHQ